MREKDWTIFGYYIDKWYTVSDYGDLVPCSYPIDYFERN